MLIVVINYKFLFRTVCIFNICERVSAFYSTSGGVLCVEKRSRGERPNAGRGWGALSGTASGIQTARAREDTGVASGSFPSHSHNFSWSLETGRITWLLRHAEERSRKRKTEIQRQTPKNTSSAGVCAFRTKQIWRVACWRRGRRSCCVSVYGKMEIPFSGVTRHNVIPNEICGFTYQFTRSQPFKYLSKK